MKRLIDYLLLPLWIANFPVTALLLLSAYSPYIDPTAHPVASCAGLTFPIFAVANFCFVLLWVVLLRFRYALLPAAGLLLCLGVLRTYCPLNPRTGLVPNDCIKLLSYNVMGLRDADSPIVGYLQESDADILCLQEYAPPQGRPQARMEEALKAYPYRCVTSIGDEQGHGNRLACFSKFPILSARKLDYRSGYNGSVAYELKIGEDTVTLINNHLESNKLTKEDKVVYESMLKSPETEKVKSGTRLLLGKLAEASALRAPQADTIARALEQTRHPYAIVCGDFNDTPVSYAHRVIGTRMDDAFSSSGKGLGISYNQNRFFFRIDHIFVSKNLKTYNCTVDRSIKESDHYPIWCYIGK